MDTVKTAPREPGKKAKQLRRAGFVPCVIYGAALEESISVQIPRADAAQLRRTKREGSLVYVQAGKKRYHTLIRELAYDVVADEVLHICFQCLEKGRKANSVADIVILNRDKVQGVLEQIQLQIPHAAEPEHLLDTVTVDVESCPPGTVITVGDIPEFQSDSIELQIDPASIVLRINDRRRTVAEPAVSAEPAE